jgi:inhibitor of cysteine peptidase
MHFTTDHESLQNGNHRISEAIHAVVIALALLTFVAGCAAKHMTTSAPPHAPPPHAKPPVMVTDSDADKPLQLSVGQTLQVRLASNPTTGYSWTVQQTPTELQLGQSVYATGSQSKNMPGAGGYQAIEFAAKFAGQGELKLEYRRPWEKDIAAAKTFSVTVTVK